MSDTTEIAVLMLKMRTLADRIIDAEGENNNGEVGKIIEMYDAADTTFKAQNILLVLNAFEAERQRADSAERDYLNEVDARTQVCLAAWRLKAEITALKGEQVPVALVDERQGSGGFCLTQYGRRLNLQHGTELFTAPQKQVLHPQLLSDIRQCVIDATAWCTHRTPPDYVRNVNAWMAAGGIVSTSDERLMQDMSGIVKDGE